MKLGKIPENVLKRSVFHQLHTKRSEVLLGAGVGEDCAVVQLAQDEVFVLSSDPITGTAQDIGSLGVYITLNDLASSGAEPVGLMLTILLPEDSEEQELKWIISQVEMACAATNVEIMGGHTEVTRAVNQTVVSVCGVGKTKVEKLITTAGAKPGQDILLTKWIGLEGTSILAKEKETELLQRFPKDFIKGAKDFDAYLSVLPESRIAMSDASYGVTAMHDVTEGGVFGAFWELAEASSAGLELDLKKIPVKQETIEICEYFGLNPYQLISSGCMLMAADRGEALAAALKQESIHAVVVGKVTEGKDRVILHGDDRRFLTPPETDELFRVL